MDSIYNSIGATYNSTRRADPYISGRLLHFLNPQPGKRYLDIGCGTGNYTGALANLGLDFTGVDPSEQMLVEARKHIHDVIWLHGTAENIPVDDRIFDGVIATLTIHHWLNLTAALKEINRVTTNKARIVLFTAIPEQMKGYWLNHYFPHMMHASIIQMPSFEKVKDALQNGGFGITALEKYDVRDDLTDYFLYAGKHNPGLYLDEKVRNGISSFVAPTNKDEVNTGLAMLYSDMESGEFDAIKRQYDDEDGDYLFIVAEKKELSNFFQSQVLNQ